MIPKEIEISLMDYFSNNQNADFKIIKRLSLSGGCINSVYRLQTSLGDFCLKFNLNDRFPGMFITEAKGLGLLWETGEIKVPEVICTGNSGSYAFILLEYIDQGKRRFNFMQDFGRSLARLHRHSADRFGLDFDNYMGSLPQSNQKHSTWNEFFIEERLKKQVQLGKGYFSSADLRGFDNLYSKLERQIPVDVPSLLHGDLWGGNYMVSHDGKPCLIDPAVYYGHREADIAMTTLFGGFEDHFYGSYNEEFPLEDGWQERLDIFNLYPLLIHLNLFGSGYLGSVLNIIRRF